MQKSQDTGTNNLTERPVFIYRSIMVIVTRCVSLYAEIAGYWH